MIGMILGVSIVTIILASIGTLGYWYWKMKKEDEKVHKKEDKLQDEIEEYNKKQKEVKDEREEYYEEIRGARKERQKEGRLKGREQTVETDDTGTENTEIVPRRKPFQVPNNTNFRRTGKPNKRNKRNPEKDWPEFE